MPRRSLRRSLLLLANTCSASLLVLTAGPLSASALSIDFDAFVHSGSGASSRGAKIEGVGFYHHRGQSENDLVTLDGDERGRRDRDRDARWKLDVLRASHVLDSRDRSDSSHRFDERREGDKAGMHDWAVWGNHSDRRFEPHFGHLFGHDRFAKFRFRIGGGHDRDCEVVPEPSTGLLVGMGLLGLGLARRRLA